MLLMLFFFLGLLIVLALITLFYVQRWEKKHHKQAHYQSNTTPFPKQGRFLTPYIPAHIAKQQRRKARAKMRHQQQTLRIKRIKTASITTLTLAVLITIGSGIYVSNPSPIVDRIELTAAEKSQLLTTHYDWKKVYPEQLPDLATELATLRTNGIVLLGTQKAIDNKRLHHLQQQAKASWIRFAQQHQITVRWCNWGNIDQCQLDYPQRLFVVLPSYWQQHKLDSLFYTGKSVLLYGEPFQTQVLNNNAHYAVYGMQFQRLVDKSHSKLALVGDRELSLGFDAGSILDVRPLSNGYQVNTTRPQAMAIDSKHHAGGTLKTRLYAQIVQKGRLVWVDFSPHEADHSSTLNQKKFQHVMAAILRYLHKKPYQGIAMWPEGRRFAALFTHDIDLSNPLNRAATEQVQRFFKRHAYPITTSVFSHQAQQYPELISTIARSSEIACAGDYALAFTLSSTQEQHERLLRCRKALSAITGNAISTFRPPEEKFIGYTLDAMMNTEISHFIAERGDDVDRFVPIIMHPIPTKLGKNLLSLPRLVSNSNELWSQLKANEQLTKQLIMREVNYVENMGGLYVFSMQSALMTETDDAHFATVKQLAHDLYQKKAYFQTATMLADWWRLRAAIVAGKETDPAAIKQFRPVRLKVNRAGEISAHWYTVIKER